MTDTTTAAIPLLPSMLAWTPRGRTPRPDNLPADVQAKLINNRKIRRRVAWWLLFVSFLVVTFRRRWLDALGFEALHPFVFSIVSISLLWAILREYRRFCWASRRLHDIGQSSRPYVKRRLIMWLSVPAFFGTIACLLLAASLDPTGSPLWGAALIAVFFGGGFLLLLSGLWLATRVYAPFDRYLHRTHGDPGPNRYGPPPVTG